MTEIRKIDENINTLIFNISIIKPQNGNISLFFAEEGNEPQKLEDTFRYERIYDSGKYLYKASDGNSYNIKELILTKISCMQDELCIGLDKKQTPAQKFKDLVNQKLNSGRTEKDLQKSLEQNWNAVNNSKDIKQIFKSQLGVDYTPGNVEKFLKNELSMKLENLYSDVTGKRPEKITSAPYIDEKWTKSSVQDKLKSTRKNLNTEEKLKYEQIRQTLGKKYQAKLRECLNSGKLLLSDSGNKNTILDSMYKIITRPRAKEVNSVTILKECIDILSNPYVITQQTEDIPDKYVRKFAPIISESETKSDLSSERKFLEEREVGTCVAASVEYYVASEHPAEFFRIVEGLTSAKKEAKKRIDCRKLDLTDDVIESYKTQYEIKNGFIEITIKADEAAYKLADMQKECQNKEERSAIDILFQSLVFQLATGNTYNSITDKTTNPDSESGESLSLVGENYALKLLTGKDIVYKTYKFLDDSGFIEKINKKEDEIRQDIDSAIQSGKSVIIGIYCIYDEASNSCSEGHELTIIGETKGIDGTEFYICKDSDAEFSRPITISKDYLTKHAFTANIQK